MLMLPPSKTTYFEHPQDVPAWQFASEIYRKCMLWYYYITGHVALPEQFSFTCAKMAMWEFRPGDKLVIHNEYGEQVHAACAHIIHQEDKTVLHCFYLHNALPASVLAWGYWETVRDGRP